MPTPALTPKVISDYFRYLPLPQAVSLWGAAITASGYTRIPPHSNYPPSKHPTDHHFSWETGRKLDVLQIVLIESGRGIFETEQTGERTVEPDTAFVLLPGVWHRYRPDFESGWTENWIEIQGPLVERLRGNQNLADASKAVVRAHELVGLEENLNEVHRLLHRERAGFDAEQSALAIRILAIWINQGRENAQLAPNTRVVARAEAWLADHVAESIDMAKLARQLGMSYSHFRRVFKSHTGVAPWQYLLHLRLAKARRLLVNDQITLADAADRLGFNSAFHLSATFKAHYGKSPLHWKRDIFRKLNRHPRPAGSQASLRAAV